jgi:hypothetical protein
MFKVPPTAREFAGKCIGDQALNASTLDVTNRETTNQVAFRSVAGEGSAIDITELSADDNNLGDSNHGGNDLMLVRSVKAHVENGGY